MTTEHNKRVLIISYYFPPSGGAGVQRTLKFVKYLREFSWEPIVLTARNADYPAYDESLAKDIPAGVKIYRSRIVEPYRLYRRLTGRKPGEATDIATLSLDETEKRKWRERIAEWVRATFFVPDARIGWLPFAVRLGLGAIKKENIRVIYSSAPPYTTHLIGLVLHKLTGLPWVADFRDSWIGWLSTPQWRPKFSRKWEMFLENSVLKHASQIVCAYPGIKRDLLNRHREYSTKSWSIIYNGYDQDDLRVPLQPRDDKFIITYTGSIYGNRDPECLMQAIEEMCRENPKTREMLRLRLIGRIDKTIVNKINKSCTSHIVEILPYMSHDKCLSYLKTGDACLLIIDQAPTEWGIIPGKIFEYIGTGRPILALAPESDAAQLVNEYRLGVVADPNNPDDIKGAIKQLFRSKPQENILAKFERKNLTGQLASLFDKTQKTIAV